MNYIQAQQVSFKDELVASHRACLPFYNVGLQVDFKIRIPLYSLHIKATDVFDEELINYFY